MSGHAHIIVVTVEDESHSSDKDDLTGLEKTTATEMCTACGRPVKDHVEAGSEFGPECKWRRQEPTPAANSREQPVDTSDVTSPPEAVPEGSSPPHTVSEDEIARMQAERDKLLHQYEVNRLQQEISTLRAALGTPRTDLTPPSQALGATVGDPNAPPPTSITPSHPITLPDVKHQPQIQKALRKLSTSVELLNNILGHSTNGDAYNGDLETLDTDQWSPSSNFNEKDRDPNSVESRTGYLRERLALQTHRLRHLSRKHNETRVGIDHVRDWLENSHAAQAVDEVKCGSTDSGVRSPAISPVSQFSGSMPDVNNIDGHRQRQRARSPSVSPTSPFGGSMQDVNSNAGQRHQSRISARSQSFQLGQQRPSADTIMPHDQGVTRAEAIMRRRSVQNERVAYWNSKLILNEEKRIQKSVVQNWLNNCHTEQTPIDRERHYSDTSGGQKESPDVAMSNSSHFAGSMPDLLNYKGKDHHGSLRSHGTTDGLDAIGEGVEEPLPEDANDEHIEAGDPKGQAANPRDSLPSTSPHEARGFQRKDDGKRPNRKIKATNACQDLATSGEASRRPSAPTHQSRKHQSVRSRARDSKSPRGVEVRTTPDIVSHFFEDERIPKTDRRPGHDPKVKGDEHVACWTKSPSRALRKLKSMMTHLSHRRQRGNSDTGFFRQDEGVSGEKVALPSRKHPEKQDVRNKKPPQDNRNPRKPRSPSRGQKKPGSPSRSPRRNHGPSRSSRRRRSPSRGPEKPGNPSRRDRPVKGKRTTKNEPGRSRSMDVGGKRPNRGQRPSARDQSKLRSRGSTETPSDGKSGLVKGKEEQRIEGKQNPSRGLKTDQTSEGNTSTGWASKMSLATTADDAGVSGSVKTRLQDDKRANWKTYKANEDLHKAPDTNAMSGFFNSFKGSFMNVLGGDEQNEKNPTEPDVPGWGEDTGSSHGKASDDSKRTSGSNGRLFHNAPPMVFVVPSSDHELSDEQNVSLGSFKAGEDNTSRRRGSRFFDSFKGSFMNLLGGDEQNEKNPTELGEPGWGEDTGSSHGKASDDSRRSSGSSGRLLYNAPPMEYVVDSSDNKLSDENLVILGSFKAGEDNTGRRRGSQPIGRGAAMLSDFASGVKTFLRIPETETVEDRGTYEDHIPGIVHNMVIGGQAGKNQAENSPSLLDSLKSSFDSWTTGESEKRRPSFVGSWKRGEDTGSHRDAGNSGFMNSLKQSLWGDSGRDQQESRGPPGFLDDLPSVQIFPPQNEKSTKRSDDKENMDWFSPRSWWSSIEDLLGMAPDEERAPRWAGPACGNQRHRRKGSDKNVDPNTLSPMDMYPRRRRGSNASAVSSASRTERRRSSDKNTDPNTLSPLSYLKSSGRRRSSASSVSGSSMPDLSWFSNIPGKKNKEKKKT